MSGAMSQLVLLGGFFAIFYFFILRPQNKRAKAHRDLLAQLSKGDEVTTNGGILGKVTRVADDFLLLMVAEGVEIRVQKQAVAHVMPKGTFKSV
jgi:preprotein translocase subunit YajC